MFKLQFDWYIMLRVAKNRMSVELIISHFMTSQIQFCGLIRDKEIFRHEFLYYIYFVLIVWEPHLQHNWK